MPGVINPFVRKWIYVEFCNSEVNLRMKKIFGKLPLSGLILLGAFAPVCCSADDEIDEHAPFAKIKKAVETNDKDLFVSSLRFPLTMCFTGVPVRYVEPSELEPFSLELILGSQNMIKAFAESAKDRRTGEAYEMAYDNEQVFGFYAHASDNEWLSLSYTSKGVYEIRDSRCSEKAPAKLTFCNNDEQDARINMFARLSKWFSNSGVYENFVDHSYSKIVAKSGYDAAGGSYEFTLNGKKLNLTRDPKSYDESPVYYDDQYEYMIMSPGMIGEDYCDGPMLCRNIPFLHVFAKKKGSQTCDPGEMVFAEKETLNFCPFNQLQNEEIRLFSEGFTTNVDSIINKQYRSGSGALLRFEGRLYSYNDEPAPENIPDSEKSNYYTRNFAVLSFNGRKYESAVGGSERNPAKIIFSSDELEIMALPEGDYDQDNTDNPSLNCVGGFYDEKCNLNPVRYVLFVRNKTGECERYSLDMAK